MDQQFDRPPDDVVALAARRATARQERDFTTADQLKSEIEARGWKVVDAGIDYRLEPARAPDIEAGGVLRYGSSESVPSLLGQASSSRATIVLEDGANITDPPAGAQMVRVTSETDASSAADGEGAELVPTAAPLGLAATWNIGIRRSTGSVIILFAPGVTTGGESVERLIEALSDESVALAGSDGLVSRDLRRWQPAPTGDVDALDAALIAFRRDDARTRGLLDERFATAHYLAIWWSLALRDAGQDAPARRAVALDLQISRQPPTEDEQEARDRATRRDSYRLIDRFGRRHDLLRDAVKPTGESSRAQRRRPPPE